MSAVGSSAMSGASRWLAAQPTGALLSTITAASAAAAMRDRVGNRLGLIICVPFALSAGRWLGVAPSESSLSDWYARRGRSGFVGRWRGPKPPRNAPAAARPPHTDLTATGPGLLGFGGAVAWSRSRLIPHEATWLGRWGGLV